MTSNLPVRDGTSQHVPLRGCDPGLSLRLFGACRFSKQKTHSRWLELRTCPQARAGYPVHQGPTPRRALPCAFEKFRRTRPLNLIIWTFPPPPAPRFLRRWKTCFCFQPARQWSEHCHPNAQITCPGSSTHTAPAQHVFVSSCNQNHVCSVLR